MRQPAGGYGSSRVSLRAGEINRLGSAHYPVEPQCETGHSTAGLRPLAPRQMVYMSMANAGSSSPWLNGNTSNYFAMGAQAILVPFEFQLPGNEVSMRRDGDRLIIEPIRKRGLIALLKTMKPLKEGLPEIDDPVPGKML